MTTQTDAQGTLTHGTVLEKTDDLVVLGLLGTDYQLHLVLRAALAQPVGQRVSGVMRARILRVDVTETGGRYVEPVYGRPRRVQGEVVARDAAANTLTLSCAPGCTMVGELVSGQKADAFAVGQLVVTKVERGAWFEPTA